MNKCVKILLERMKTNPEEFGGSGKWVYIMHNFKDIFTEEEAKALGKQYREVRLPMFEKEVMGALLTDEDQLELDLNPKPMSKTTTGKLFNYT
jgi:hypothetical protein